jgi:hypothetical protein
MFLLEEKRTLLASKRMSVAVTDLILNAITFSDKRFFPAYVSSVSSGPNFLSQ